MEDQFRKENKLDYAVYHYACDLMEKRFEKFVTKE